MAMKKSMMKPKSKKSDPKDVQSGYSKGMAQYSQNMKGSPSAGTRAATKRADSKDMKQAAGRNAGTWKAVFEMDKANARRRIDEKGSSGFGKTAPKKKAPMKKSSSKGSMY